jgi:hypothetical protein
MRRTILILAAILIPNALVRAEAPASHEAIDASHPVAASVRPATPEQLDPNVFRCGPILAQEPQTRTRIQQLYKQQWDLRQDTMARLKDLAARAQTETDSDARFALNKQGGQLKRELQQRNMELGLEIARLNGDAPRVAEFETALDHLLHPEKYMPVMNPAEIQARRARELGNAK